MAYHDLQILQINHWVCPNAGIEVACNLQQASAELQQILLAAVKKHCHIQGIEVLKDYVIGKFPEDYINEAKSHQEAGGRHA